MWKKGSGQGRQGEKWQVYRGEQGRTNYQPKQQKDQPTLILSDLMHFHIHIELFHLMQEILYSNKILYVHMHFPFWLDRLHKNLYKLVTEYLNSSSLGAGMLKLPSSINNILPSNSKGM